MRYKIHWKQQGDHPRGASTVITRDERVVWTTPALKWAVGWRIGHLLDALYRKMARWELVGQEYEPRPETVE